MIAPRAALAVVLVTVALAPLGAQEPAPDRSLDRMRAVLAVPPLRLTPPETAATFKITIKAIHPLHEIFDTPLWATDPVGWQPPSIGLDLAFVFRYMAAVKHSHDEHVARDNVQRAIADYCATQPNPETIQICSPSRILR